MATGRVSQQRLEVVLLADGNAARVSRDVLEVVIPVISRSPTTPTGAGVTKDVLEILLLEDTAAARVTQDVLEVVLLDLSTAGEAGTGPNLTRSFGYAV